MRFMTPEDAQEFAGYIRGALHQKQEILTPTNGILIENGNIGIGVFTLSKQPIIFDSTCYGLVLNVYRGTDLQMALPLDNTGQVDIYIGMPGTYAYEIDMLPGIPYFHIERTYIQSTDYPAISLSVSQPTKADMYPFATATNEQLMGMLASYYLGLYDSTEIATLKSTYMPIGAKRSVHLDHMDAGYGCDEDHFGPNGDDYEFVIIGFEHDDLVEQYGEKNKALLTLLQDRILYKNTTDDTYYYSSDGGYPSKLDGGGKMHNSGNWPYASWNDCDRRNWCRNVYKNAIEDGIKKHVKNVVKETYLYDGNNYNFNVSEEDVFLLSEWECWGEQRYREQEGEQYEYFQQDIKNLNRMPCYNDGTPSSPSSYKYTGAYWWLRTLCYSGDFGTIYGYGYSSDEPPASYRPYYTYNYLTYRYGIAPAFCI